MADENKEDRSLPASPRRLEKAREEGQVARSRELGAAAVTAAAIGGLWLAGPSVMASGASLLRSGLAFDRGAAMTTERALTRFGDLSFAAAVSFSPLLLVLAGAALLAAIALGGWNFTTKPLVPNFTRLSPLAGIGRMFSSEALIELAKATLKALALAAAAAWIIVFSIPELAATATAGNAGFALAGQVLIEGSAILLAVLAILAAIDVPVAIFRHGKRLRMTPVEMKQEMKELEGDPHVKARIRGLQRAMARRRMMAAVPTATVVVTNPTHYAVAIEWREGLRTPRVVAKGAGLVAERIREIARASGVALLEAPALARALNRHVEIGGEVPPALYQAVAQVLAWVFQVKAATGRGPAPPPPGDVAVPAGLDPAAGAAP
ncbi:MAG: flagellar biosynthesis protein FlhB [Betaproteobacteria bacterium]|nr:flagellar biosynthesis protein FlhB [Betaproteobacteria bacterium]